MNSWNLYNSLPDEFQDEERPTIDASDMEAMNKEAERLIEEAAEKPAVQSYFVREDTGHLVKTEKEYYHCQNNRIPLKIVPFGIAAGLLKEEDAAKRRKEKVKKKKKMARASRKRNRS